MVLPDKRPSAQPKLPPRSERRPKMIRLEKRRRKLLQRLRRANLEVVFDNDTTTAFGNFASIETFKRAIGFSEMIDQHFSYQKHWNSTYSSHQLLDYLTDSCILGLSRFDHMEALRSDPGYKKVKDVSEVPSEGRYRDLLSHLEGSHLKELLEINQDIIRLKSQWEGPREVWLDYDDTVITLFGNQTDGEVGYNPRYRGRPSYKAKLCFISGTDELLNLKLYGGKTHSNGQFLEFHEDCERLLPHNYVLKGIRVDKGFFDEENIECFENRCLLYVIKLSMRERLRRQILALPEDSWQDLDDCFSVAEMEYLPTGWKFPRRVAVIREKVVKDTGQMYLPENSFYKYQAIMTNMEESPEEVWHFYNKRGNCENRIDEIKDGFGVEENSQHEMLRNRAFAMVKVIAYNLVNWFKRVTLPGSNYEVQTIRRVVLNVAGNIVGNGWYRRIRLAANPRLEHLISIIKANLDRFSWFVANDFIPLRI